MWLLAIQSFRYSFMHFDLDTLICIMLRGIIKKSFCLLEKLNQNDVQADRSRSPNKYDLREGIYLTVERQECAGMWRCDTCTVY